MPNGKNPEWLKKELYRVLSLAKIGSLRKNKELIDKAIDLFTEYINATTRQPSKKDKTAR